MTQTLAPAIPVSLGDAFAYCEALTKAHYENFPVGSRLVPKALRPHVCSIYAFARTADDFADEPGLETDERLQRLDEWGERLQTCLNTPQGPIFTALAETIRCHQVPHDLLHDLLRAFRMDVTTPRHRTFDDLLAYCRYSAMPVGRLILHLFGYHNTQRHRLSDAICTALQLANFWQDIAVDFSRGRIYLPQKDMKQFGVTEDDLANQRVTQPFRSLLNHEIDRTRAIFQQGRPLPDQVSGRLKFELRLTYLGGMEILNKIRRNGYDIYQKRPQITGRDSVRLLFHTFFFWKNTGRPAGRPCTDP